MRLIGKLSQYEKIVKYMKDPDSDTTGLTEHDKNVMDRYQEAFTFLRDYKSTSAAVILLMKRFPGLSRAQAFVDCKKSISLFGDIGKASKEGMRNLALEFVLDAIAIAKIKNNEMGIIRGGLAIERIAGVNKVDPDLPDFSKLEKNTYNINLPPTMVKLLELMAKSGRIDLTQVVTNMGNLAQDAVIVEDDGE